MLVNKLDLRDALDHMISVSELGRGKASKVIQDVESTKDQYIVVKNNKPQAVIISIDEYKELMEAKDELNLLVEAQSRISNMDEKEMTSFEDLLNEEGIEMKEIDDLKDSVVIE